MEPKPINIGNKKQFIWPFLFLNADDLGPLSIYFNSNIVARYFDLNLW